MPARRAIEASMSQGNSTWLKFNNAKRDMVDQRLVAGQANQQLIWL
jgi:hypothetical protein